MDEFYPVIMKRPFGGNAQGNVNVQGNAQNRRGESSLRLF
ncbi:hypothetical protein CLOSTASPAR_03778 [[Clostridium] asparagiforme DSM 15981]|uniref:Uncharacterized protein n=1 Tax=[Clostridium] asparagiforme DSM 15981 TaxID=518636 RepID=C0D3D7_9FIRM|nr:hypothetical protein CLOSTASPAR_03778 [[Clostridium] asparagiforme DSM 15981]